MRIHPVKKITPSLIAKDSEGQKRSPSEIRKRKLIVMGRVIGFRKTSKNFGDKISESIGFKGIFEASEILEGAEIQRWRGSELFLPSFLENELELAFTNASLNSDSLQSVSIDIAVEMSVKIRPDLACGYEWIAKSLIPPTSDPFESLRKSIDSNKLQIPSNN